MSKTDWKSKATSNARDKKQLNKRIRELICSRDEWKEKSINHKARADKFEAEFIKLKKKLTEIIDKP
jgi:hypothetical protein